MNEKHILQERLKYLTRLREDIQSKLEKAPEGTIRIRNCRSNIQYFVFDNSKYKTGKYLPVSKRNIAEKYAQKSYYSSLLKPIDAEVRVLEKCIDAYPETLAEDVYSQLHPERRRLVNPLRLPDEEFVLKWNSMQYETKGFDNRDTTSFYTALNERVRSKSEQLIADILHDMDIPYHYEFPLKCRNGVTIYTDFLLLNKRTRREYRYEHFGMMDNPTYANNMVLKLRTYEKDGYYAGINFLTSYETSSNPVDTGMLRRMFKKYLL